MNVLGRAQRRLYAGGRPGRLARVLNRVSGAVYAAGIRPHRLVTLQVHGRRTGRVISFPLVMVEIDGSRYLVAMLGEKATWVRNVRASGVPMAGVLFPGPAAGLALLPLMLFHQIQLMACAVIAQRYANRPDTETANR